jgi:hypothetical protein
MTKSSEWLKTYDEQVADAKRIAKIRAEKTGLTQYVGMRYDTILYVSKILPRPDSLIATVEAS